MKAVIPAAGKGKRMKGLTQTKAKPMLPLHGKPILQHILERLRDRLSIARFVVVVGYLKDTIVEFFGDGRALGVEIQYVLQHEQRGLAHAILQAEPFIDSQFVAHWGDSVFLDPNFQEILDLHREKKAHVTIAFEKLTPEQLKTYLGGFLVLDDENNVIDLVEKPECPPSDKIFSAFCVLTPCIFEAIRRIIPSKGGELNLPDAVKLLVEDGKRVIATSIRGGRHHFTGPLDVFSVESFL